jgi:type IV secretory pathway VirB9-like protein
MRTAAVPIAVLLYTLPACAMDEPIRDKADPRVGYFNYNPNKVYHIWTAPEGSLTIRFPADERPKQVSGPDTCCNDHHKRGVQPIPEIYGNAQIIILRGCIQPQPLLITTWKPSGEFRYYQFEIETVPPVCERSPTDGAMVRAAALGGPNIGPDPPAGDLKTASDSLSQGSGMLYQVVFRDPDAERAKRAAAAAAREAQARRREADLLLKQQTQWPFGNPYDGSWKYKFKAQGDPSLAPSEVREDGSRTVFIFLAMAPLPTITYLLPRHAKCGESKEGVEAAPNYSVHRGASVGDTIVVDGIHRDWCLRYAKSVLQVHEFEFNPVGSVTGTGTVSPDVVRVQTGADDAR